LSFTEEHPDVVRIKERLEILRNEANERLPNTSGPGVDSVDMNPVYQELKIQSNQAELELSQLNSQYSNQKRIVDDLQQKIDTIPMIEAELARLNRAYDENKSLHRVLLERLQTARLSEDAEMSNTGMQFRLIEPPTLATAPIGPDRELFMTLGLIVALVVGIGVA
jgi:uncharacterized protein involved in exopolysaccharide biosynthesis